MFIRAAAMNESKGARAIHEAGRGFSRGSGLGGSPASSLLFLG